MLRCSAICSGVSRGLVGEHACELVGPQVAQSRKHPDCRGSTAAPAPPRTDSRSREGVQTPPPLFHESPVTRCFGLPRGSFDAVALAPHVETRCARGQSLPSAAKFRTSETKSRPARRRVFGDRNSQRHSSRASVGAGDRYGSGGRNSDSSRQPGSTSSRACATRG